MKTTAQFQTPESDGEVEASNDDSVKPAQGGNAYENPADNREADGFTIENTAEGNPFGMEVKKRPAPREKGDVLKTILKILNYIFIDGLSGMAIGLFATLIIGTIISQIGSFIPGAVGKYIGYIGTFAKAMMGAGIGIGMAYKLKKAPMVSISAGVAGMIGAFASNIIAGQYGHSRQ